MNDEFEDEFEDLGLLKFSELSGVCERHIINGHNPFDEDEFLKVVRWMEETRMNTILMNLVLEGKIDIVFDKDTIEAAGGNEDTGLLFTMSNEAREEARELGIIPDESTNSDSFFNLKFNDEEDDEEDDEPS